jgi:hypothetical protein
MPCLFRRETTGAFFHSRGWIFWLLRDAKDLRGGARCRSERGPREQKRGRLRAEKLCKWPIAPSPRSRGGTRSAARRFRTPFELALMASAASLAVGRRPARRRAWMRCVLGAVRLGCKCVRVSCSTRRARGRSERSGAQRGGHPELFGARRAHIAHTRHRPGGRNQSRVTRSCRQPSPPPTRPGPGARSRPIHSLATGLRQLT